MKSGVGGMVRLQLPLDCTQSLPSLTQIPPSLLHASTRKPKPGCRLWSADHLVEKRPDRL